MIGPDAPRWIDGQRLGGENLADRVMTDRAAEARPADGGNLAQAEGRVLGLQFDDRAADLGREHPAIAGGRDGLVEEAPHSVVDKLCGLPA